MNKIFYKNRTHLTFFFSLVFLPVSPHGFEHFVRKRIYYPKVNKQSIVVLTSIFILHFLITK